MTFKDKERGRKIMQQALSIITPDKTTEELKQTVLTYGVIIYELKIKLASLEADNMRYINALLAIQENNLPHLKDELIGAYNCLKEKLEDSTKMLDMVKISGGTIGIDFVIEYNRSIQAGLDTIMQFIIKVTNHEDFDISINV